MRSLAGWWTAVVARVAFVAAATTAWVAFALHFSAGHDLLLAVAGVAALGAVAAAVVGLGPNRRSPRFAKAALVAGAVLVLVVGVATLTADDTDKAASVAAAGVAAAGVAAAILAAGLVARATPFGGGPAHGFVASVAVAAGACVVAVLAAALLAVDWASLTALVHGQMLALLRGALVVGVASLVVTAALFRAPKAPPVATTKG